MTREEAIDFLKSEREATIKLANTCNADQTDYFKKHEEAYDIAIKSLEEWELVKKEIKQMRLHYGYIDIQGSTIIKVLEIIDKHLSEVEK